MQDCLRCYTARMHAEAAGRQLHGCQPAHLEAHTGDITHGVTATTETCNEHLILQASTADRAAQQRSSIHISKTTCACASACQTGNTTLPPTLHPASQPCTAGPPCTPAANLHNSHALPLLLDPSHSQALPLPHISSGKALACSTLYVHLPAPAVVPRHLGEDASQSQVSAPIISSTGLRQRTACTSICCKILARNAGLAATQLMFSSPE